MNYILYSEHFQEQSLKQFVSLDSDPKVLRMNSVRADKTSRYLKFRLQLGISVSWRSGS